MNRLLPPHRFCLLLLILPLVCRAAAPNIVVIMVDDVGWRDLHGYGNALVDTPYLDQLARDGMKFTDAYAAAPVCSPTRAAMMTGQSPARVRLTNHAPGNPNGFSLPERLADEAIHFIRAHRDGPFFLNWWPYCAHYPFQAPEALIMKYRQRKGLQIKPVFAAMLEAMDAAIGRFLRALDDAGLRDNTLVLFTSDNGGYDGDNRPLRGIKGMLYEGGIRVPWIMRWSGKIKPGTINTTPIISTDCYPTLLAVADLPPTPDHPLDGRSLVPLFTQSPGFERDSLYFHYPNYAFHKQNRLASAIREGSYKLIKYYDDGSLELYDLSKDISEKQNLAAKSPEIAARLAAKLDRWLRETDARLPVKATAKPEAQGAKK